MKSLYKDFVGVYTDIYPEGYCEHLIKAFDFREKNNAGTVRHRQELELAAKHVKDDSTLLSFILPGALFPPFNDMSSDSVFFYGLQECFNDYNEKFTILKDTELLASEMKMQRTSPGGGYHTWHYERSGSACRNRVLTYILYLNTLKPEDGGETEFLYQKLRVPAERNKLIIWPADYTHTHRGNLVLGDEYKYIITGWFITNE